MKAEVTISNIYWNKHLASFFFTQQAYKTLEELVQHSSMGGQQTIDTLDEQTNDMDIDDVNNMFHDDSVEELAEQFGIELEEEEDEE